MPKPRHRRSKIRLCAVCNQMADMSERSIYSIIWQTCSDCCDKAVYETNKWGHRYMTAESRKLIVDSYNRLKQRAMSRRVRPENMVVE